MRLASFGIGETTRFGSMGDVSYLCYVLSIVVQCFHSNGRTRRSQGSSLLLAELKTIVGRPRDYWVVSLAEWSSEVLPHAEYHDGPVAIRFSAPEGSSALFSRSRSGGKRSTG